MPASVIPATVARVQANAAPTVALVAVYEKVLLPQIAAGANVLLKTGDGLTVTTTFWEAPAQPFAVVV
jgi:hypothetical protein